MPKRVIANLLVSAARPLSVTDGSRPVKYVRSRRRLAVDSRLLRSEICVPRRRERARLRIYIYTYIYLISPFPTPAVWSVHCEPTASIREIDRKPRAVTTSQCARFVIATYSRFSVFRFPAFVHRPVVTLLSPLPSSRFFARPFSRHVPA